MNKNAILVMMFGSALTLGMAAQASAAVGAAASQKFNPSVPSVQVGPTQVMPGPHGGVAGEPGIGVSTVGHGAIVSFDGLTKLAPTNTDGVTPISMAITPLDPKQPIPPSHGQMGVFNFAQVASEPVYFGEWSATGAETDATHTAYYAGKDVTAVMPVAGQATYAVKGINQYSTNGLMEGSLTADFGQSVLVGTMANSKSTLGIVAPIKGSAFEGQAYMIESSGVEFGSSQGHFFGNNASALAGIATFTDSTNDTAFGGSRQN